MTLEHECDADKALLEGLGLAVERRRLERGWTRQKLARAAGLVPNAISALEEGEQEPTWRDLRLLAQGLGMELEDLNDLAIDLAPGPGGDELRLDRADAAEAYQSRQPQGSEPKLPLVTVDTFGVSELLALTDRTARLLRLRSGIEDGKPHNLREAGEKLKIGAERARQIQNEGLTLIRQLREVQRHLRRDDEVTIRRGGRSEDGSQAV